MFTRKAKVEKYNKKLVRELKSQKFKSMVEKTNVVERMRVIFEREKEVAVSDATLALEGDLRKSNRGVECLKHTLLKSEVFFLQISFTVRSPRHFKLVSSSLRFFRCKTMY